MKLKILFGIMLIIVASVGFYFWHDNSPENLVKRINQALQNNDIETAFVLLDKGIDKFPQRLDIKFGKIYLCQLNKNISCMQEGIEAVINQSSNPGNVWLWKNDTVTDNSFMLESIQAYQKFFFDNEFDDALKHTAEVILKVYPDHYKSLNSLGILAILNNECDTAKKYLDKAQDLAPSDLLIKNNYNEYLKRCPKKQYPLQNN